MMRRVLVQDWDLLLKALFLIRHCIPASVVLAPIREEEVGNETRRCWLSIWVTMYLYCVAFMLRQLKERKEASKYQYTIVVAIGYSGSVFN